VSLQFTVTPNVSPLQCAIGLNVFKYHHTVSPPGLHTAATLALLLLLVAWSHLRPSSYLRGREALALALRLLAATSPVLSELALLVATQVARNALQAGAAGGGAAFLAGLLFVSHAPRLAIMGLGLPLHAGAHAVLQLAMLVLARREDVDTCMALLTAGASVPIGAVGRLDRHCSGGGSLPHCGGASRPAVDPHIAAMVGDWHASFSVVSMWLRPLLPLPRALGPAQQCQMLLSMFQLSLGLAVPVLVHWVREARMYHSWQLQQQQAGQQQAGQQQAGQQQAGQQQGAVVRTAGSSGPDPAVGPAKDRVYIWTWWAVEQVNAPVVVLIAGALLAGVWEILTAAIP
jgi:hypothetical protein